MKTKYFIFLLVTVFLTIAITYSEPVSSFSGTTGNYTVSSKGDSITSPSSSSTNFVQRFIGGIMVVVQYFSNLFTGRFGILDAGATVTFYGCGNLTLANTIYILNNTVNSSGTCFNIVANSVTLDCNNSIINYSQLINGYGIANNGYNNKADKTCKR